MNKCKLCLENEADKKGSHIVSHFLMKRINNHNSKKREKELGFVVEKLETKGYFGRGIAVEVLNEIYGEVDDELIANNKIEGIVDHYFCSKCEENLSIIESEYSKSINVFSGNYENYQSSNIPSVGFFFWASIIWRLSIQENSGFKLNTKDEKKLRRILNKYIPNLKININDVDLQDIGYKLLRNPNYDDPTSTYLHWEPNYQRPYSILINEYLLFFYFKKNHLKGLILDFYGTEELKSKSIFNTPFSIENILTISKADLKEVISKVNLRIVRIRLNEYDIILNKLHKKLGGKGEMDIYVKNQILLNIVNSDAPLGKKYSIENVKKIIADTMMDIFSPKTV